MTQDERWNLMYNYAKNYYEHHGNLEVPKNFKTNDGYTYNEEGFIKLYNWISWQKKNYNKEILNDQRIELLRKIGMIFENKYITWEDSYNYAKLYYQNHGNLEVPNKFKTNDGYTYDKNGKINLGKWISHQRIHYKNGLLSIQQIELLKKIEIRFENKINKIDWEEWYKYAKKYYEKHGNLEVPKNFKTNDGCTYDKFGKISLGYWIFNQRANYKKENLNEERINLLKKIGMRFDHKVNEIYLLTWEEWYKYAKKYYEIHSNLDIQCNFKTKNGYSYDSNGVNLGKWIQNQRKNYQEGTLDKDRKELLDKIGMCFENKKSKINNINKINNNSWNKRYNYAKKYYEYYGNLEISFYFKTKDGYTYDDEGFNLGSWIDSQIKKFKNKTLKQSRIELLEQIGINWDMNFKKNGCGTELSMVCKQYQINIEKNYNVLKNISIQELNAKIEYLKSNKLPLYNKEGILHEIFDMSNSDIKERYGMSLEEILSLYKEKNKVRRR